MDDLVFDYRSTKSLAVARVFDRLFDRARATGDAAERRVHALFLKLLHLIDESLAFVADPVSHWDPNVLEVEFGRIGGVHAELLQFLRHRYTLGPFPAFPERHDDQGLVAVDRSFAGIGEHAHPVGLRSAGDERLRTVDHVVVAGAHGAGLDRGNVGTGRGLGNANATHHVTRDGRRQKLP